MAFLFLKYCSFKRICNLIKLHVSYIISVIIKQNLNISYPFSLTLEPTNQCNLHCPECPSGAGKLERANGRMEMELYKKVIDETSPFAFHLMLYFQGEPYLNPQFTDMVSYAKQKKLYVSTSTNAQFITPENARKTIQCGLDKIIISMDGTTQEVYEIYRKGGSLEKVFEGIKNLVGAKNELKLKTPLIEIQFLVFSHNEHQMKEATGLAKKLGADKIRFKTAQIYDFDKIDELLPSNPKYTRYVIHKDKTISLKKNLNNRCKRLWTTSVITFDGNIVPCCYDKDGKYCMGNVSLDNFLNIWKNEAFNQFRKKILHYRKKIDICRNCW